MIKNHFKTTFALLSFILITLIVASTALSGNLFGPKKYQRTHGPSNTYKDTFQATGGKGTLTIINGDADGDNRVTSGSIYLNGKEIFDSGDFIHSNHDRDRDNHDRKGHDKDDSGKHYKHQTHKLEKSVKLKNGTNTIKVVLKGKPGSYITIEVTGNVIPPPTVNINTDPVSIAAGASSILSWTTTNADTCSIDQGIGDVPINGNVTVNPTQTTTYTITAMGTGGTITANVTVNIIPPPTVQISADPASINTGGASTLTWSSTNADTCSIDQGIGNVAVSGNVTVNPTQTTTYTITATGIGGTKTASITVTVTNPNNPPYVTISAIPNEITTGGSTQLSWSSSGGQSAFIDNGVGVVALSGTVTVNPLHTTIYTVSVTGQTGNAAAEVTVIVKGNTAKPPAGSFGEKYSDLIPKDAAIPAYDVKRFSMVTGLVQNLSGAPLSDVTIFFHDRPEYGTVKTDANGRFSIPIDGGTTMTLTYKKQG